MVHIKRLAFILLVVASISVFAFAIKSSQVQVQLSPGRIVSCSAPDVISPEKKDLEGQASVSSSTVIEITAPVKIVVPLLPGESGRLCTGSQEPEKRAIEECKTLLLSKQKQKDIDLVSSLAIKSCNDKTKYFICQTANLCPAGQTQNPNSPCRTGGKPSAYLAPPTGEPACVPEACHVTQLSIPSGGYRISQVGSDGGGNCVFECSSGVRPMISATAKGSTCLFCQDSCSNIQ